jgi:phosphoenolpyruvate carboxylase
VVRRYALSLHAPAGERFFGMLRHEHDLALRAVLRVSGRPVLGDESPIIARSIRERNPWTDVLNLVQIDLLERRRHAPPEEHAVLEPLLLQSVSAIAAAMQSTG